MKKIFILILTISILLIGCTTTSNDKSKEITELNIGLMPAVDTAPIFLAKDQGYFADKNIKVNIEVYTNAQDRQSALQTNSIDGAMTDLIAVATNVNSGFNIKATTLTDGMFVILANESSIKKENISVGMMEISVSNFLVDHWIGDKYNIEKVYINAIPARLEAVASNKLDMGLFPEPIASVGSMKGLKKLTYKPIDGFSPDVMVFTDEARNNKAEAIKAFHAAYNMAVEDIKTDENLARETLIKNIPNIDEKFKNEMTLPEYHKARLPNDEYLNKIIDWTNGVLEEPLNIKAEDLIDESYLDE